MTSADDWEERARQALDPVYYDYFAGGAGDESALRANRRAFARRRLLPRVLRGAEPRDLAVDLPGAPGTCPILVSPTAFHKLAHPEGELATARAAAAAGCVLTSGMAATVSIADVAAAARGVDPEAAVWFQLYLQPEPAVTDCLARRAADAGCTALVVTVDSPVFGRHGRDRRHGFHELPDGLACENMRDLPGGSAGGPRDIAMSPLLSWDDLDRLRDNTELPIVVKGILHPGDARLAAEHGAAAVMVSNHGGRQLDAAPATLDVLPAVADALDRRIPALLDGGVRHGADVAIALATGAAAVGVGRPVLWGLAADGEKGVRDVLERLRDDLDHTLALCGGRELADLTADLVTTGGPS
ncbi:MAG TPA: alpha-hydroxy acid oxidase [Stackebrandtia sp.]|uniref:alpha-hydroxy acid oxidase n=1 Tax=Stackebrandtia sp. TaxID=2023065 RepID=UPI002D22232A|nr:alpha-hydroxy acid oxidase [Stackebrandtia sp.]HZE37550.1 alpha-hydroxy acid oxidase [Stackebrandtia sp.]